MFLADIYGTKEGEEEKDDRQTLQVDYNKILHNGRSSWDCSNTPPRWRHTTVSWRRTE